MPAKKTGEAWKLLTRNLNPIQQRLNRRLLDGLFERFSDARNEAIRRTRTQLKKIPRVARQKWLEESPLCLERRRPENAEARDLFDFLFRAIEQDLAWLKQARLRNSQFHHAIAQVNLPSERQRLMLNYASDFGASRRELHRDERAFQRWFDEDALRDRFLRRSGQREQYLAFSLQRLGQITRRIVEIVLSNAEPSKTGVALVELWRRLNLETIVQESLVYEGDSRIQVAALNCLAESLSSVPRESAGAMLDDRTLAFVHRAALDTQLDVAIQCEALVLLNKVSADETNTLIRRRLLNAEPGDDMFVRRCAVRLLGENLATDPALIELFEALSIDPSPFVRQQFASIVWVAPLETSVKWIRHLALNDECPQVRAAVVVAALEHVGQESLRVPFLKIVTDALAAETDEFVVRTILHVAHQWLEKFVETCCTESPHFNDVISVFQSQILRGIANLQKESESIPVRRWSAQANERIWLLLDPDARSLFLDLRDRLADLAPGKSRRIPNRALRGHSRDSIGRVFAVLAQDDFGFDLRRGWLGNYVTRGPIFRFRLWRFWFELMHSATDKRQAFRHTIGRASDATIRAPSQVMAELSQTKVPGEPLFVSSDGGSRPFLPLVDDMISVLDQSWLWPRTVSFYTSEGVTEVTAPRNPLARIRAAYRLTFRFSEYAQLRNWDDDPNTQPEKYIQELRNLGFKINLRPHDETESTSVEDQSVSRFFACLLAVGLPSISTSWEFLRDYANYFGSAFENSLVHLLAFAAVALVIFLGKHLLSNIGLAIARRSIPLSIGGWGTRGKSGTERLKAALFGALGHGMVSKTTGCEAMFIQSHAFGDMLEIPLFRPYDKATIWEHRDLIVMASRMGPSVFLWECMGLTPSYVDVLQRQWTCDDLGTITNTFPDHEDLQGPAGYNVATTIAGFVPRRSRLLTTEQQMRPLVAASCESVGTTLRGIGWLESGLLTDDMLDRFPYKEHPDNIALVAAMADELGCGFDFAVKAMADYLVPDLGVLKTYPVSEIRTRKIEFTNGMSANERFGCLGNWKRLEYDKHDPLTEPGTWICGVVNNRADRVPRSRVFASLLVNDVQADRHFLIGTNLKGLQGFISEAWSARIENYKLCDDEQSWDASQALEMFTQAATSLRQPTSVEHIQGALKVMSETTEVEQDLDQHWANPESVQQLLLAGGVESSLVDAIEKHHQQLLKSHQEFTELAKDIKSSSPTDCPALDRRFVELMETWFRRKIVVIEDRDASGEEIITRIVEETPPGFLNRVMGLQNIKGTGMDFIYRFQAWDPCHEACEQLSDSSANVAERGLQTIAAMPVIGQLCEAKVRDAIHKGRRSPTLQRSEIQSQFDLIESKLAESQSDSSTESNQKQRSAIMDWILNATEQYLDINDAVRRRNTADQIYADLVAERISRQRAVLELRKINKRQKGGWLAQGSSREK